MKSISLTHAAMTPSMRVTRFGRVSGLARYAALALFALAVLCAPDAQAQSGGTDDADRVTVTLSDPSRPAYIKANILNGSIHVKGYGGKEILVESKARPLGAGEVDEEEEDHELSERDLQRRKGMRRITGSGGSLTVEEDDNEVTIGTGWRGMSKTLDMTIQVPQQSSLKLSTLNDGTISITGVKGDIEVSNLNGPITMKDISGSVVADALNEDIDVVFTGIDPKKSMSFSSLNGDIDVTIPSDSRATIKMKNDMGEIYSDFDMKMDNTTSRVEDNRQGKRGKYKVTVEKFMTGAINGGGAEMSFKNFNGDIYIRKGK